MRSGKPEPWRYMSFRAKPVQTEKASGSGAEQKRKRRGMNKIFCGDALDELRKLPDAFIDCCITSPPYYGLRNYGVDGQIGLEQTPEAYVAKLVAIFREVRRVLKDKGTLWLNLGDSYCGYKGDNYGRTKGNLPTHCTSVIETGSRLDTGTPQTSGVKNKDLIGTPWMVAFALRADGWYLRSDIIWHKPNPMPESVTDRPTKSHEYIFLLSKSQKYYYDSEAIKEPATKKPDKKQSANRYNNGDSHYATKTGIAAARCKDYRLTGRNKRTVWTIPTKPYKEAHFATFPEALIEPCILAGCPENGTALDPFFGAGTTGLVAKKHNRQYIGIELNPEYVEIAKRRIGVDQLTLERCNVETLYNAIIGEEI
jgi:DNA modification methylase